MTQAYIGLGANLGDAGATLRHAAADIARIPGVSDLRLSPFYRSAPVDSGGPDYVNAVAALRTSLAARQLLRELQRIELQYGRTRPYRNAPRTLDLDLLLYGNERIAAPDLIVPHPRMHERAFVLAPLADLEPGLRLAQGALSELLRQCASQAIERLD
ncbi:2-amino-4-hydroxy-6-hydroxymethyldihydropteridine diphosphokinase [Candidimonas nitroreducens]|uniref:2-amino-4-hydroxy-6-hydroxymethyldihydropteridine pyrophosphokinase n=1 Tax=Candidimonas nitroreducens TaxID=683354 RepID=A0A225MNG8_9BURK|nr:2-amino-4-hydroxy-6-hydroxymethyldihydropteridine diphosphokinase [Candidimonas nitroreducens]OWT60319.1 2-amino-4-hydroxy-6-hydroxymethyldihydropteridine diphosphokinase [Candidimonas nitroreducens]